MGQRNNGAPAFSVELRLCGLPITDTDPIDYLYLGLAKQ